MVEGGGFGDHIEHAQPFILSGRPDEEEVDYKCPAPCSIARIAGM